MSDARSLNGAGALQSCRSGLSAAENLCVARRRADKQDRMTVRDRVRHSKPIGKLIERRIEWRPLALPVCRETCGGGRCRSPVGGAAYLMPRNSATLLRALDQRWYSQLHAFPSRLPRDALKNFLPDQIDRR